MVFIRVTAITLRLINVLNASRKSFISTRKRNCTQFWLNFVSSQSDFSANKKAAMTSQTIQKKTKKKEKHRVKSQPSKKKGREGKQKKKTGGENVFQLN